LYNGGFDDKAIMARSGHRSDAVHCYKRPSIVQELSVSKALDVPDDDERSGVKRPRCATASEASLQNVDDSVSMNSARNECSSCIRIELPDNIDTVIISKNGREIKVTV